MDSKVMRIKSEHQNNQVRELVWYLAGITFTILYAFFALNLWDYDFSVPFWYHDGDNLSVAITMKRLMDGFFKNDLLGAPMQSLSIDYPIYGDTLNILAFKVLTVLTNSVGMSINLFYLALFPLTFCTSFFVMRKGGIPAFLAFSGACIYTFLPYRFLRNTAHIWLSNYSFVPLSIYLCICIYTEDHDQKTYKRWTFFIMIAVLALSGIYYAFFTCFLIVLTTGVRFLKEHRLPRLGIISLAGIVGLILIAMIPSEIILYIYGENPESPVRSVIEAEVYGLKITQFFLPNSSHGMKWLEDLYQAYAQAPVPNEGSEYLGIVGACGLLLSIAVLFVGANKDKTLDVLSKLTVGAILLGTIGGFGSLFALLVSPQIRGYNRISVFVAFCSIYTLVKGLAFIFVKIRFKRSFLAVAVIIFAGSLWEQTRFDEGALRACAEDYYSDDAFVKQIEEYASEGAMIYQYPYHRHPESPPINAMGDYALARGYIHSDSLRWSYGDYKGRNADLWHRTLAEKPLSEQIEIIGVFGFEGIYIDRYAYTDTTLAELCGTIEQVTGGAQQFSSENGRLLFYGLKDYQQALKNQYSASELEELRERQMISTYYTNGFSGQEGGEGASWRWCDQTGEIHFYNFLDEERNVHLKATVYSGYPEESTLEIQVGEENIPYEISSAGTAIELQFVVQPGENRIAFITDAAQVDAPGDPRSLYIRFENLEWQQN